MFLLPLHSQAAGARRDITSEAGLMPFHFATEGSDVEALVKCTVLPDA